MYNGPEHYLDSDANASRLMAHARLLLKLSRRFEAIAPAGFRHAARVANYKSGKIVIHADNGAVAAARRLVRQEVLRAIEPLSRVAGRYVATVVELPTPMRFGAA